MSLLLPTKLSIDVVEVLISLNNWSNNILLNITVLRLLYYFLNPQKFKVNLTIVHIIGFLVILILDNWISYLPIDRDDFYYSNVASIFLAHCFTKNIAPHKQFFGIISIVITLFLIDSSALIQICFILTMLILLFEIKNNLLKSSNQRRITVVLIPITAYIYFAAQEYTLAQVGQDWANSNLLIYFSIGDYIVFTTMIIIINANLRRLFFN